MGAASSKIKSSRRGTKASIPSINNLDIEEVASEESDKSDTSDEYLSPEALQQLKESQAKADGSQRFRKSKGIMTQ